MTGQDRFADDVTTEVLEGFEISLYRWNLLTDRLDWVGSETALMQATGLDDIASGTAFAEHREDGGERTAWALAARHGETARFVFAVPVGIAGVTWIEEQAKRWDIDGVPHVTGVLRRAAAPRGARTAPARGEREGRAELLDILNRAGRGQDRSLTLLAIDSIRDLTRALGLDVVDEIVAEVEARLSVAKMPRSETGRIAGGKFALVESGSDPQTLAQDIRRIMDVIGRKEIATALGPVTVSVSAGVCHVPRGAALPADPIASALVALDEARIGRIEGLRFARPGTGSAATREKYASGARLVMDAIAEGRMTIAFQPVVRSDETGTVAFNECLCRILDREGTVVPAGSFMPSIEHLGLIRHVDRTVLRATLATLAGHPDQRLSVNLSPQSMHDSEWLSILESEAAATPGLVDRLILEVTESSAMLDPARTLGFMNRVRALGCAFALDDFGAGYTSFRHFRDFRFDAVKIDGSFVTGIARNRDNQILVNTLVSIADHFSMFTVAEFVENDEDAAFLQGIGIDFLQGYRYGVPTLNPAWLSAGKEVTRLRA